MLRLRPEPDGPLLFRSYSLSGLLSDERYRVSVKVEPNGAAGSYLNNGVRTGDVLDVSEPRGGFTLQPGDGPVVLLSAGIGATPMLAMLHALAAHASPREVWWLTAHATGSHMPSPRKCGDSSECLLAAEAASGTAGRMRTTESGELRFARSSGDAGPPGPARSARGGLLFLRTNGLLGDLKMGLSAWGVPAERIHSEIFSGGPSLMPGVISGPVRAPHPPGGVPGAGPLVSFARSGITVRWGRRKTQTLLELAERVTFPSGGRAAAVSATTAKAG